MRTMKVRIWDKVEHRYVDYDENFALAFDDEGSLNFCAIDWRNYDLIAQDDKRYVIELGSGILDRNDKEVFEGDIICCERRSKRTNWVVTFQDGCLGGASLAEIGFRGGWYALTAAGWWDEDGLFDVSVIGNIHKNPELLGDCKWLTAE